MRAVFQTFRIFGLTITVAIWSVACSTFAAPRPTATLEKSARAVTLAPVTPTASPSPEPAFPFSFQVLDIAFIDPNQGWALGTFGNGFTRGQIAMRVTVDGGKTWQSAPAPEIEIPPGDLPLRHLRFANAKDGWAFEPGFFSTHDGGKTWGNENRQGKVIAIEPIGNSVWVVEQNCQKVEPYQCQFALLIWNPAQQIWAPAPGKLPAGIQKLFRVSATEAWLLSTEESYTPVYSRNRIFVTRDGGLTWSEPNPGITHTGCSHLAMDKGKQLWLFCGSGPATMMQIKNIWLSRDEGKQWSKIADAIPDSLGGGLNNLPIIGFMWDVAVVSKERAFIALIHQSVIGTTDGGQTWNDVIDFFDGNAIGGFRRVIFVDELHGWATPGQNLIFRTRDGGATWEQIEIP